jgi:hypothetical protein
MMRSSRIILSCLIGALLVTVASAQWVPLTDSVPLSSLQGGPFIFGDKMLSEISLSEGIGEGGAIPPTSASLLIQGGQDSVTGDYGVKFNLSWSAISNQIVSASVSFKVSILPGYDDYFIKDVAMYLTGVSANGTGGVHISETVWDVPFGNVIASLSCSKQANDGGAYLADRAEFAPLKEIWIYSKDISVAGGTNGSAHISEFYQFYSQIPEPMTIALLGLGGLLLRRRR